MLIRRGGYLVTSDEGSKGVGESPTPSSKTKDPDATFGAELGSPKFDELRKLACETDTLKADQFFLQGLSSVMQDTRALTVDTDASTVDE